jgi:CheY-like chemotaxis protein
VAEDDAEMRELMVGALQRDEYEVRGLGSGLALFDELRRMRADDTPMPALIVSDMRMPGLDGLSLLSRVRGWGLSVPFILVTAFASEETMAEARAGGATAVFSKPFDVDDLRLAAMYVLDGV